MKAIVYSRYGSPNVLKLRDVDKPVPRDDEVLVKIHASSVNSRDWRLLRANPFFIRLMKGGFFGPKKPILGADMVGRIEAVGNQVRQFQPGDEVFGYVSGQDRSTFAEYVCAGENEIALKPAGLSFEEAAAVPLAAITALQGLRILGNLHAGQAVVIQGASGGVGSFAVQIAKAFGGVVTAVCSRRNVEMARRLGADHVIDYAQEDFTKNGKQYDLILAVNGFHPIQDYLRAVKPEGAYIVAGGAMRQLLEAGLRSRRKAGAGGRKVQIVSLVQNQKDLALMTELLESGKVAPVIDACYPLHETAAAFWYFEKVHPKGKVVISMDQGNT